MTIDLEILVSAAVVLSVLGVGIGYWWASINQRRASGGKSVAELNAEKQAYQEQVEDHFKTTADLLNEMTDKYRDVYRHMAEGAQNLVASENVAPALAALQSGMLAAPAVQSQPAEIEQDANEIASEVDESVDIELDGNVSDEGAEQPITPIPDQEVDAQTAPTSGFPQAGESSSEDNASTETKNHPLNEGESVNPRDVSGAFFTGQDATNDKK